MPWSGLGFLLSLMSVEDLYGICFRGPDDKICTAPLFRTLLWLRLLGGASSWERLVMIMIFVSTIPSFAVCTLPAEEVLYGIIQLAGAHSSCTGHHSPHNRPIPRLLVDWSEGCCLPLQFDFSGNSFLRFLSPSLILNDLTFCLLLWFDVSMISCREHYNSIFLLVSFKEKLGEYSFTSRLLLLMIICRHSCFSPAWLLWERT